VNLLLSSPAGVRWEQIIGRRGHIRVTRPLR